MADTKISAMTSAGSLTGSEIVPVVQSGANKQTTSQAIADLGFSHFLSATLNTDAPNDTYNTTFLKAAGGPYDWRQDLVLAPRGAGAVSFTLPTGDGVGGNLRGSFAVDLQIFLPNKGSATQVASGDASAIGGGFLNTAASYCSVVGGGYSNLVQGNYTTIAGGRNNTVPDYDGFIGGGHGNSAGGGIAVVCGGENNATSAQYGSILGGYSQTVSAAYGSVGGGYGNTASGASATVAGGYGNVATGECSWIPGGRYATTRGVIGLGAWASQALGVPGDTQATTLTLRGITGDATPAKITSDTLVAAANNQLAVVAHGVTLFRGQVAAADSSSGDVKTWVIEGTIKRTDTTAIVGLVDVDVIAADTGTDTWAVTAVADTTNHALSVQVTGQAARTIFWVARLESVELVFG